VIDELAPGTVHERPAEPPAWRPCWDPRTNRKWVGTESGPRAAVFRLDEAVSATRRGALRWGGNLCGRSFWLVLRFPEFLAEEPAEIYSDLRIDSHDLHELVVWENIRVGIFNRYAGGIRR
jgi:hypothetical protein